MNYLIDTNVISALIAKQRDRQVVEWLQTVDDQRMYLSIITIGELRKGLDLMVASRRKQQLEQWYRYELLIQFKLNIIPIDLRVIEVWGEMMAALQKKGRILPLADALIAATALAHNLTIATRNVQDFVGAGVSVFNPWQV